MLSVIIPTRNRREDLVACLERLSPKIAFNERIDYEVIVTDDGDDSLEEFLACHFGWVQYNRGPKRGPAANRNSGARIAKGDWLVFTDDDCLPEPNWLHAYFEAAQANDSDVLEGKTIAVGPRPRADMESPINLVGGRLWSCNFAIKHAVFKSMNGFDLNFPAAAMEDVDLLYRLKTNKHKVSFVPEAVVGHPWRIRKNIKYVKQHTLSTSYFLNKFPEAWKDFGLRSIVANGFRRIARTIKVNILAGRWQGLTREVCILTYSTCGLIYELYVSRLWRRNDKSSTKGD